MLLACACGALSQTLNLLPPVKLHLRLSDVLTTGSVVSKTQLRYPASSSYYSTPRPASLYSNCIGQPHVDSCAGSLCAPHCVLSKFKSQLDNFT